MDREEFDQIATELWEGVPEHFKQKIQNVALLIENMPSPEVLKAEGLTEDDTLLGLYQGIPNTLRGEGYGVGATLPDTITLYRTPIMDLAEDDLHAGGWFTDEEYKRHVRVIIGETLWHEIGHYFGLSEEEIDRREKEGTNYFLQQQ